MSKRGDFLGEQREASPVSGQRLTHCRPRSSFTIQKSIFLTDQFTPRFLPPPRPGKDANSTNSILGKIEGGNSSRLKFPNAFRISRKWNSRRNKFTTPINDGPFWLFEDQLLLVRSMKEYSTGMLNKFCCWIKLIEQPIISGILTLYEIIEFVHGRPVSV